MSALRGFTLSLACSLLGASAAGAAHPDGRPAHLSPDWSGWWVPQFAALNRRDLDAENHISILEVPPVKPEYRAEFQKLLGVVVSAGDANALYRVSADIYCRPFQFNGAGLLGMEPESALEFLFNPGRVTIADELDRVRRVYLDPSADLTQRLHQYGETNTGISVGHWEGNILVIDTSGLSHLTRLSFFNFPFGGVEVGKGAQVTERIALKRKDVLQVESTLNAPEVLTGPYKRTLLYQREADHVPHEFTYCNDYDREIDPESGRQRFDLTPPADLPPPPSR